MARKASTRVQVTIASAAAVSGAFKPAGQRIAGVIVPSAWTAADISFELEEPSGTWVKLVDPAGALVKITGVATALSEAMLPPEIADRVAHYGAMRLVSTNTASEANINQDAARTLTLILEAA